MKFQFLVILFMLTLSGCSTFETLGMSQDEKLFYERCQKMPLGQMMDCRSFAQKQAEALAESREAGSQNEWIGAESYCLQNINNTQICDEVFDLGVPQYRVDMYIECRQNATAQECNPHK